MNLSRRLYRLLVIGVFSSIVSIGFGGIFSTGPYSPVPLRGNVPASECFGKAGGIKTLNRATDKGAITVAGIPFHLMGANSPLCITTALEAVTNVNVPIGSPARAIYLLAATRAEKPLRQLPFFGCQFDGYSDDSYFHARIHYRDHSSEEVIPRVFPSGEYLAGDWKLGMDKKMAVMTLHEDDGTTPSLFVYCIEPGKRERIESVELMDMNDRFALALFATTIDNQKAISREPKVLAEEKPLPVENLAEVAPTLLKEGAVLIGRSTRLNFALDLSKGLAFREMSGAGRLGKILRIPEGTTPCPLFKIKVGETTLKAEDFRVNHVKIMGNDRQSTAILSLNPINTSVPVDLKIALGLANPGTLRMRITVEARQACKASPVFPMIQDIGLGAAPEKNGYYFPIKGGVVHDRPVDLCSRYLGMSAQEQFMDIYDKSIGGGLTLRVEDNHDFGKTFEFRKMEGHEPFKTQGWRSAPEYIPSFDRKTKDLSAMAVQYLPWNLDAGEKFNFPETVLEVHQGDWREAMGLYMTWIKTWYRPDERPDWVKKIFLVGAPTQDDYVVNPVRGVTENNRQPIVPLGGVDNSNLSMKNIRDYEDLVCFYQWHLGSRERPNWFLGDHDFYPGDPQNFRTFLKKIQARGIRTSVYTQYYLIDDDSKIAKAKGEAWTRRNADGSYFGGYWKYFPCHEQKDFQDYVTSATERIVHGLDLDGVYFDQDSRCPVDCYTASHHHKTPSGLAGTTEMFKRIHEGARRSNPLLAIWSEEIGTEPMAQYLDLAYSYTCFYDLKEMPRELAIQGENFYRFMFPDYKIVEIAGNESDEGVRLAFFNATGFLSSFTNPFCENLWRKLHRAFQRHKDAFSSLKVEPLVPTRREGLYSNGFYCAYEKVYTLFNSNYRSMQGEMMELPAIDGAVYTNIFTGKELQTMRRGEKMAVMGEMGPREVSGIVVTLPGK